MAKKKERRLEIRMMVCEEEHDAVAREAERMGVGLSTWLRTIMRKATGLAQQDGR